MARTPTVNRLQLGTVVRNHRIDAGLSQAELGRKVFEDVGDHAAQTRVAKIENGERQPDGLELSALQSALGIRDPKLVELMKSMYKKSSQRGRWGGYRAVYDESFRKYIDLEEDADLFCDVSVGLMSDLLMCESYIRAICEGCAETSDLFEANVEARLARTRLLDDDNRDRNFHFLLCESAVRKAPGGRAVVREQIAHIIDLSERPHIEIQVVPFIQTSKHAADSILYAFTYLHIPAEHTAPSFEYVHIGAPDYRRYLDKPSAVRAYLDRFTKGADCGIGGDDAVLFLKEIWRENR